jgi:hypothetical protein
MIEKITIRIASIVFLLMLFFSAILIFAELFSFCLIGKGIDFIDSLKFLAITIILLPIITALIYIAAFIDKLKSK